MQYSTFQLRKNNFIGVAEHETVFLKVLWWKTDAYSLYARAAFIKGGVAVP